MINKTEKFFYNNIGHLQQMIADNHRKLMFIQKAWIGFLVFQKTKKKTFPLFCRQVFGSCYLLPWLPWNQHCFIVVMTTLKSAMFFLMDPALWAGDKSQVAHITFVRPLTSVVLPLVYVQLRVGDTGYVTLVTLVRHFSCMLSQVDFEDRACYVTLSTYVAFVRFFTCMFTQVDFELWTGETASSTDLTLVRLFTCVFSQVNF